MSSLMKHASDWLSRRAYTNSFLSGVALWCSQTGTIKECESQAFSFWGSWVLTRWEVITTSSVLLEGASGLSVCCGALGVALCREVG